MVYCIAVLLGVIVVYLGMRLFLLHRNIEHLTFDFEELTQTRLSDRNLQLSSPDKKLERLAYIINGYISDNFEHEIKLILQEKNTRGEITNITHDLRTPLTSILGYLNLLEVQGLSEEESSLYLGVIKRRSQNLAQMVEQLYDYSRLENQDLKIQLEQVDLHHIFKEHILSFYIEFEKNNIDVNLELGAEPVWIMADKECLSRIFNNLTSNTLKYSNDKVNITLERMSGSVSISYKNEGRGLNEFDVSHLFDRYYRKNEIESAHRSGLGLTIAKLLTEKMNGSMEAFLDKKWLIIKFTFPICPK